MVDRIRNVNWNPKETEKEVAPKLNRPLTPTEAALSSFVASKMSTYKEGSNLASLMELELCKVEGDTDPARIVSLGKKWTVEGITVGDAKKVLLAFRAAAMEAESVESKEADENFILCRGIGKVLIGDADHTPELLMPWTDMLTMMLEQMEAPKDVQSIMTLLCITAHAMYTLSYPKAYKALQEGRYTCAWTEKRGETPPCPPTT